MLDSFVRIPRIFYALVVAICIAVPLMESIDTWDDWSRDGNETEIHVVVATLCVGFALAATRRLQTTPLAELRAIHRPCQAALPRQQMTARCIALSPPTDSPPLPLRI